ncbi:hypothetical protein DUNSADRAFT_12617 [Dunaliella salina]|uniref:J domain-containing protein n=1 Tax=Dunaliella salina TaxID=3046 RepID=A0ABQ7GAW8_DUNSA|nr:hypothetical protein DUNSADRAFT_12617 [Dunaliella salina]|eukprot:KAF5831747.1 hypothetical protein DUNSADRAFT_12617 [Dunaliella salina]
MQYLLGRGGPQLRPQRSFNVGTRRGTHTHTRLPRAGRHSGKKNYYDLLGVEVDASEEEIKAAFRRRAKELHPDVNSEADAEEAFIQVNTAYETLGDEEKRISYNRLHGLGGRRLNFFQDVDFESEGLPFSWQRRRWSSSARPDDDSGSLDFEEMGGPEDDEFIESTPFGRDFRRRWRQRQHSGFRWSDLGSDDEEWRVGVDAEADDEGEEGPDSVGDERSAKDMAAAEARRLEALLGVLGRMNASGVMTARDWGSGRMDPWGTGTSEAWHRKVEQQKTDPFPGRSGMGGPFYPRPTEWTPPGRGEDDGFGSGRIGWTPPGRSVGDPRQGGGGGSRRWGGDDGGFSGRPL